MTRAKVGSKPRPKKIKPKVRRRRPGWIRRSAVRAGKMTVATWKFGRWAYDGYVERRAVRAEGRAAAGGIPSTVTGNAYRPNRRPTGQMFMPKRHDKRRWYSRNIHYSADGSVTTTPTVAYTWWGRLLAALFDRGRDRWVRAAQRRADNIERLGKPRDRVERMERKIVLRRERRAGRGKFTCQECLPPLNQFKTAAELNAHFRSRHLDDDAGRATGEGRPRGMPQQSQPRHRAQPGRHRPSGPNMPGAPTRPRVYLVDPPKGADPRATAWGPNIDKIKGAVMANGTGIANSLQQWGEYVPNGVGSLREDFAELETMGSALEEAVTQKIMNLSQGAGPLEGRPIAEDVLAQLRPLLDAAQTIARSSAASLATFEDEYAEDIRRAKAQDRPTEDWLAAGA